jgi:hypothetical protein
MPKNLCCCEQGGTFLAIPCRYYRVGKVDVSNGEQLLFPQNPSGTPVVGPKRWGINSGDVFDTTRQIIFMMRGGGGGSNLAGKGGNGAYAEYVQTASLTLRARAGRGGTGAQILGVSSFPFAGGGIGYRATAFGGGGSVIGSSSPLGQGNATGVVGGGGGAGTDYNGGHGGSTFGFTGDGPFGGGGGSQSSGGIPGGGVLPAGASPATTGSRTRGGHGMRQQSPTIGYGGGGGGGYWGGGGGGLCSGGGGASSLRKPERTEFFIDGTDDGPGAGCNFHLGVGPNDIPWGLAGNRQTSGGVNNNSNNGQQGVVAYYYIDKYCICDYPGDPEPPEKVFLCLNKEQRDAIINQLGPQPSEFYSPVFELDGEKYHLLGQGSATCSEICESAFRSNSIPTNVKWRLGVGTVPDPGEAPGGCCEYIQCFKVCDLTPCNKCECEDNKYYCCETDDKPNVYWSIRGTSLYRCEKRADAYIDFGKTPEALGYGTNLCMPITSTTNIENRCDEVDNNCTIELEPADPNSIYSEFPTYTTSGTACDIGRELADACFNPSCLTSTPRSRSIDTTRQFNFIDGGGFFGYSCIIGGDCPDPATCVGGPNAYARLKLIASSEYLPEGQEQIIFEVEFSCDSQTNNNAVKIRDPNPNEYIVCGATVFCLSPGTFLSNIAAALNSILGTSTVQVRASGGYHVVDLGAYRDEYFPVSGNLKKRTWYTNVTPTYIKGIGTVDAAFPCAPFDVYVKNNTMSFETNTVLLKDYLNVGPSILNVTTKYGDISCAGQAERWCDDVIYRCACGANQGCEDYGNCVETCRTDPTNYNVTFS